MEVCYWAVLFMPLVISHHFLNVSVQLANKRGLKKKKRSKKNYNPAKFQQGPKFMCSYLHVHYKKTFWEDNFKNIPKSHWGKNFLNASQFGSWAHHSAALQCMRLIDVVTLHFNSNMLMAVVFSDIKNAFSTTWFSGLLYKLSELEIFYKFLFSWLLLFSLTGNLMFQ
jgi:hypothetical protein